MNKDLLVKSEIRGNQKIEVYYDSCADSPCTSWDMGCCYLFEYSDSHRLNDECHWRELWNPKYFDNNHSLEDSLRQLVSDYVDEKFIRKYVKEGNVDGLRIRYDRSDNVWYVEEYVDYFKDWCYFIACTPKEWKEWSYAGEIMEKLEYDEMFDLLDKYGKDIVVKETSTTGYCQGDYCKILCFCTKERFDKYIGGDEKTWKQHALDLMDVETEEIGKWMWGDVLGYVLYDLTEDIWNEGDARNLDDDSNWEESESCWGYYMDADNLIDEILGKEETENA